MSNSLTACFFIGVEEGFSGVATITPQNAADEINSNLKDIPYPFSVFPALAVYDTSVGCPQGGEPIAAVFIDAPADDTMNIAQSLRDQFKQTSVGILTSSSSSTKTISFKAKIDAPLETVAKLWQKKASELYKKTGSYSSAGLYAPEGKTTVVIAYANPKYIKDQKLWIDTIQTVLGQVCAKLEIQKPDVEINETGFAYLSTQDRIQSVLENIDSQVQPK